MFSRPRLHRRRPVLTLAAACVVAASVLSACTSGNSAPPAASQGSVTSGSTSTAAPEPSSSTPKPPPAPTPAQVRARAAHQLGQVIKAQPAGGVSVAALNLATGRSFFAGARSGMRTASAYKLLMVVAVLLQHGGLSDYEYDLAERALENSDNAAGYSLYLDIGGAGGVQSAIDDLGMHHTQCCPSDPTLMQTNARDYLQVVKAIAVPGKISASSRHTVLDLMRNVESDQRWGIGVVADKDTTFANKNGWLSIDNSNGPGDTDDGRWAVTSVGLAQVHGQQVLMSVFTQHQSDFETGVHLVERLARLTAPMVEKV